MFGRKKSRSSSDTLVHDQPTKAQLKRATRTRKIYTLLTSLLLLISIVFLILVEIGNTRVNDIINDIYFIKLDLADVIPVSVPNSQLINSIAQTIGLHDYYTVGLWGWCMGNYGEGITFCSEPQTLYWFNPVEILQGQLLAGATSRFSATNTEERALCKGTQMLTIISQSPSPPKSTTSSASSASPQTGCSASSLVAPA